MKRSTYLTRMVLATRLTPNARTTAESSIILDAACTQIIPEINVVRNVHQEKHYLKRIKMDPMGATASAQTAVRVRWMDGWSAGRSGAESRLWSVGWPRSSVSMNM